MNMDTTLVTVTLLSMAMAASLSVIVWRMLRDERRRSDARVVALTAMATRPSTAAPRELDADLSIREAPVPTAGMFAEREVSSPWSHRFAGMAGLGLVLASGVLFSFVANGRTASQRAPAPVDPPPAPPQPVGTPTASTASDL